MRRKDRQPLERGKLTLEEIAEYSGLSITEVKQLAGIHAV